MKSHTRKMNAEDDPHAPTLSLAAEHDFGVPTGRGMKALKALQKGDVVLELPYENLVTPKKCWGFLVILHFSITHNLYLTITELHGRNTVLVTSMTTEITQNDNNVIISFLEFIRFCDVLRSYVFHSICVVSCEVGVSSRCVASSVLLLLHVQRLLRTFVLSL